MMVRIECYFKSFGLDICSNTWTELIFFKYFFKFLFQKPFLSQF